MKLMKKVLVLALAAATILMVACDNGNGGGGTSSSETDGNGGGTSTGADTFVPPTLPESKGTDPFAGLETLTIDSYVRYAVDTTKKVLTEELSKDDKTWIKSAEYSYSYDGKATPPTITGRIEAQYEEGTRVTPAKALDANENKLKKGFYTTFSNILDVYSGMEDATKKKDYLDFINTNFGLTLTEADLAADKEDTLAKILNSESVKDVIEEQQDTLKKMFSMTPTYAVVLTDKSGTSAEIAVEGQYDSKLVWHEQTAGSFVGMSNDATTNVYFFFNQAYRSAKIDGKAYTVTDITESTISCRDENGTSMSLSYTTSKTGKEPVVTITVEAGKTIECIWQPSTTIGQLY